MNILPSFFRCCPLQSARQRRFRRPGSSDKYTPSAPVRKGAQPPPADRRAGMLYIAIAADTESGNAPMNRHPLSLLSAGAAIAAAWLVAAAQPLAAAEPAWPQRT